MVYINFVKMTPRIRTQGAPIHTHTLPQMTW